MKFEETERVAIELRKVVSGSTADPDLRHILTPSEEGELKGVGYYMCELLSEFKHI